MPQSIRTDLGGAASCMIVMSLHMTSGRPPAADGTWMQGPLVRHLIFKALRCILNTCSVQSDFFPRNYCHSLNRGCFVMCLLLYVGLDSQYITHRLAISVYSSAPSRYASTTSLFPFCGLSVSAPAAVMFSLSVTPPPTLHWDLWYTSPSRDFSWGRGGGLRDCLLVDHIIN